MNSRVMVATMATAVTTTNGIPVGEWRSASIQASTFSAKFLGASVAVAVQVSDDDVTYKPLTRMLTSSAVFVNVAVAVPSGTGNYVVEIPGATNHNYMRLVTDTATSNTYEFKVVVAN